MTETNVITPKRGMFQTDIDQTPKTGMIHTTNIAETDHVKVRHMVTYRSWQLKAELIHHYHLLLGSQQREGAETQLQEVPGQNHLLLTETEL